MYFAATNVCFYIVQTNLCKFNFRVFSTTLDMEIEQKLLKLLCMI